MNCRVLTFFDTGGCTALGGVEPLRWVTNAGTSLCIDDECRSCTIPLVADGVCSEAPELNLIYRVVGEAADVYTLNGASCGVFDGADGGTLGTGYIIVAAVIIGAGILHRVLRPAPAATQLRL